MRCLDESRSRVSCATGATGLPRRGGSEVFCGSATGSSTSDTLVVDGDPLAPRALARLIRSAIYL
jgi:hypothetical protein